jgi:pimeloyl-ACP methyl ester carboxylesterase
MLNSLRIGVDCSFHSPCIELNYYDEGSGESVVLIHGLGANLDSWLPQIEALSKAYRVIALDLRGHGNSGHREEEPITLKRFADDISFLLKRKALDKAHFCGLSMGGLIALEIFIRYKSRVKSLILSNTTAFYPPPQMLEERLRLLDTMELDDWGKMVAGLTLHPGAPLELRQKVAQMFAKNQRAPYRQALITTFTSDFSWVLPLIDVPTLILVGEEDQVTPIGYALFLHRYIKNSVLRVISGAAHLSNLENPAEFNRAIKEHLEQGLRGKA